MCSRPICESHWYVRIHKKNAFSTVYIGSWSQSNYINLSFYSYSNTSWNPSWGPWKTSHKGQIRASCLPSRQNQSEYMTKTVVWRRGQWPISGPDTTRLAPPRLLSVYADKLTTRVAQTLGLGLDPASRQALSAANVERFSKDMWNYFSRWWHTLC